jgi:hypothetical protein
LKHKPKVYERVQGRIFFSAALLFQHKEVNGGKKLRTGAALCKREFGKFEKEEKRISNNKQGGKTRSKHFPDVNKQNHQRMCKHIVATQKRTEDTTRFPHISTIITDPGDGDTRKDTETTTATKTKSDFVFPAEDLQIEKKKQKAERKETVLSSLPLHPRRQNITKHKVLVTNLLTTRSSKSS